MNATRAAAWPRYRTENPVSRTGRPAQFRPDLRVVHHAGTPAAHARATAPGTVSCAATPVTVPRPAPVPLVAASLVAASLVAAPLVPARLVPARQLAPPPFSKASPLRLTRRGRIVVAVMAALLVAGLSLAAAGAAQATGHFASSRASNPNLTRVVVLPGQTLWSVAENADPQADPRQIIQQIAQLNALTGDTIAIGQRLWVPRS